jgi:hypothetical protein
MNLSLKAVVESSRMDRRIAYLRTTVVSVTVALAIAAPCSFAQTLAEPNPPSKSAPQPAARPAPAKHVKTCAAYGAGFMQMPGTDACIKIGGYVSVGVTH